MFTIRQLTRFLSQESVPNPGCTRARDLRSGRKMPKFEDSRSSRRESREESNGVL
jgi:hypothetical protein